MSLREVLTKERKWIEVADTVNAAIYTYSFGPLFGVVLGAIGSKPINSLRKAVRQDLEPFDFGETFKDRYLEGFRAVRDAFNYRPPKAEEVCLGENI